VVAAWIAETQAERRLAEQRDRATPPKVTKTGDRPGEDEIVAIVEELGDMVTALRVAEPEHKLDVYRNLGLRLTYDPETRTVRTDIDLAAKMSPRTSIEEIDPVRNVPSLLVARKPWFSSTAASALRAASYSNW
jgi:hypothetical protein